MGWSNRVSTDRKSTRLNSSHRTISYAVFCLNKKKIETTVVVRIYDLSLGTRILVVGVPVVFPEGVVARATSGFHGAKATRAPFFFFMIPRPTSSTLFPYTTLFR